MRVEVRGVGGEHDWAASRLDPHALQTLRVAADMVDGDSRRDLVLAVVKGDASVKHFAHHRHHVIDLERQPQRHVAHAAARCICHLAILQVIARPRKQIVVADMIVMHVADDDRLHLRWLDADRFQPFPYRLDHLALAFSAHRRIEAGVDNDRTGRADNRPNIEVERLQHVVRVAADEVLRRFAIVVPVSNGIDLMRVVAHSFSPSGISRKSYARGAERRG